MELKSNGRRVFRNGKRSVGRIYHLAGTMPATGVKSLSFLIVFFLTFHLSFSSTISSKSSGNWSSASTWNGGTVPGAGDVVTISSGNTVTVDVASGCKGLTVKGTLAMSDDLAVAGSVTINSGGTLNCGSNTLSLSGTAALSNSGTFTAGSGTVAFSGTSNSTSGTITFNDVQVSNASISFGTGATVNGDLTLTGGYGMTAAPAYGSSSTLKFDGSYTVYSRNSTWPSGSGSTVPVNVEVVSGTLNLSWNTLSIRGNIIADAGATFDASTTTLTFAGSSPSISGSGTVSLGAITIGSGCSFTMASDLSIGSLTVSTGGTFNASSYDLTITGGAGSITNSGTFNAGTGTVIFTPQWVGSATTGTIAFNNVICNSAVTFNTGATINGYLQLNGVGISTSPAYGSTATLKINGSYTMWSSDNTWPAGAGSTVPTNVEIVSGTFNCNKDVNLKGTLTVDAGAAFVCANNSFTFAGTSNSITGSGTVTLGDVTIGSTCVFTLSSNTTFNGITINAGGVFNCGSYTLTLKGGYSGTGTITNNGTFNAGTGTVAFTGTSGNTSTGTITYNNVSVNNAPATFNTGATVNGNLTLNGVGLNGSPAYGSSSVLQFNGSNTIYSSSSTWPTGSGSTVPVNIEVISGTVTLSYATRTIRGNITVDNGAAFDAGTSTLTFTGANPVITGNATLGDVIIASGCNFSISNATTFNSLTVNSGGTFNTNSNTLTLDGGAASLTNNGTFNAGTGIVNMYGTSSNTIAGTVTLNNVDVKNTTLTLSNATTTTINGTLTLDNTGSSPAMSASPVYGSSGRLKFNGSYTIYSTDNTWPSGTGTNVAPYIEVAAGTLTISSTTRTVKSNLVLSGGTLSGGTNLVLSNGATIDRSNGSLSAAPTFGTSVNIIYSQATAATTTGPELPTSTTVLQALTINNSNGVTLAANATINGALTFTSGKLSTGTYTATIGSAGSVSGAGSAAYVNGKLAMNFSSTKKTQTFNIGSSTAYAPITLTFASVTTSGNITVSTTNGDQPNIASACLVSTKSVNRYWTLTNTTVAPVSFSATFNFVSGDLDAGATYSNFVVARYASSAWTNLTTGTKTATSTAASSITAFGDFQVAESGSATINTQPSSTAICPSSNTSFSVVASGAGLSYQWKVNTGSGWTSLSNTGIYSGATTATLTLTAATTGYNGYKYECVVSSSCGSPSTSSAATLTINSLPAISSSPSNVNICSGSNATFTISASGTGLTYQWQEYNGTSWSNITNGGIYSGATTASLTLTGATSAINEFQYKCVVNGTCTPAVTSGAATLTVNTAPAVSSSPSNVTICAGANTSFTVSATGTSLTYQWQVNTGSGWANVTNTGIYSGATTSTLSLTGATSTQNGYQYRCVVSGTCSPSATSGAATLTINTAPSITSSPSNVTICSGGNATFSVSAIGTALTYQWQEYNGTAWSNITNGGIYSGATTASLTVTGATTAGQYRCVVSGTCSPSATSSAATLTINTAPAITSSPSNVTICSGGNATFSVSATGTALTYQWQSYDGTNWNNISAATSASLTITGATTAGQYRCIVSGTCSPSATSSAATLTINTAPSITSSPSNITICSGGNATFSVSATGTGLTYQWQSYDGSNWNNISGATSASLTVTGATTAGQYRCVVSGTCSPSATSSAASLTINTAPAITSSPSNVTICSGSNATFSVSATGTALTYQWQDYDGTNWNNISGATSASLTVTGATTAGQYRCIVSGTCSPSATSSAATLTINSAPAITSSPSNVTICSGSNATFSVSATGTGLTYQWQEYNGTSWSNITNGGIYSGATTASLTLTGATNAYRYKCIVSGTCSPAATSGTATLTINTAPAITSSPSSTTICSGGNATFSVSAAGTGLTYQWQDYDGTNWNNISGATTASLTLTSATTAGQYRCVVSGTCSPSVTSSAATLTINTAPAITSSPSNVTICSGSDATFSVSATGTTLAYQWQDYDGTNWNNIPGATSASLTVTGATTAGQYRCVVSGTCSPSVTSSAATLTINTAPAITSSPSNVTICSGGNATFFVSATGTALTYQWQSYDGSNWNDISGATSDSLTVTGATTAGQYRCVVSGTCGSAATTSSATLIINTVPTISSNPGNSTICAGANTSFTVLASGTSLSYQWQEYNGTAWSDIGNGGIYSGALTATLSLTGVDSTVNNYQYRCKISGTCSPAATSNAATLTVNAAPAITSSPANTTACNAGNTSFSVSATGTSISYRWQENTGSSWADISNGGIYSGATTATLALTGVTTSMDTYQYRCVVSGTCTPPAYSSAATLSVTQVPAISSQPLSTSTCLLSNAVFSVTASSTASLSYQWQVNDGTGWSNITALSLVYTGYTSNTLTLASATAAMSGYMYRCQVINCSGFTTSNTVVLTVNPNGTWIGGSSHNWKDPANWCGGIPTASTNIYIDSTAPTMPVTDSTATITCNDLIIQNGAKVTMGNNLKVNGTLYLYGQLNMATDTLNINGLIVYTTGQMTGNGNSSIVIGGTGAATTLPGVTIQNLQLNRANGLYLGGDVTVKGTLALTSGKLYVGANTLTINSTPTGTASNLVTTSSSSLNVAGTSSVTIPSSVDSLNNLTINNSAAASAGGVALSSNVTVKGAVTLTKGYLSLGTNNLVIAGTGSISGYDSTKYIVTQNSPTTGGVVKQNISNNNTDVIFPVGTAAGYAPIKIKLTSGSTADQYSIRVFDGVYKSGTSGSTYTTHTINKTWYIDEATIGGSNATLTVGWTRGAENTGLNRSKVGIAHYTSGAWNMPGSWGSATTANNAYWVSRSGITSFSPFTTVDSTVSQTTVGVNVKVFLQGPFSTSTKTMSNSLNTGGYIPTAQPYNTSPWSYSGTESVKSTFFTSNRSIVDWVLVELRTGTASTTKVAQRACFIKTDGTLVDTDGVSAVAFNVAAGSYYIVIKHRNHLSVMTASAVSLAIGGNTQYDFTTALSKAYGSISPMKLLTTGYYGMYAGDGNANGSITAADYVTVWRPLNGHAGYQKSDYNLSGSSTAADYVTYWRTNNGKATQVP